MEKQDIFDLYLEYVENSSEASFQFHRWSFLTGVAALLGRQVWLPFGGDLVYPNMYTILLGPSASRKSSAINMSKKLLACVGYDKFAKEKSSKEQFLMDLAKGFGRHKLTLEEAEALCNEEWDNPDPHEVLICAGELEDFLGAKDSGFISLLTNLYDNLPKYEHPKLTGKDVYVPKPTVSLLGGATSQTFTTIFPPEATGQGILSRIPLIYAADRRCRITLPPPPPTELHQFLVERLQMVASSIHGPMSVAPEAFKMIDDIYQADFPIEDARLASYSGRRHMNLWKLCVIYAAVNLRMTIEPEDVLRANSVLHHAELFMPKALGEFGRSQNSATTDTVMAAIQRVTKSGGADINQLMKACSNDLRDMKELGDILRKLMAAQKIATAGGGMKFIALPSTNKKNYPHVDFTLLREYDAGLLTNK